MTGPTSSECLTTGVPVTPLGQADDDSLSLSAPTHLAIVEDDPLQRFALVMMLEDLGFSVLGAVETHKDAAQLLDEIGDRIGCFLVDLDLAGTHPQALLTSLTARRIPFVAVTGLDRSQIHEMGLTCEVVEKPYSEGSLMQSIRRAIA